MATYTSQYPIAQSDDYVKVTTRFSDLFFPYFATNPALLLTGSWGSNCWISQNTVKTNQRFHIDLGSAKIIRRIYYENGHNSGGSVKTGSKNFTFWGSNTGAGTFDDLVYENDEGWTQLDISQSTFDIHVALDQEDPKYITVTNVTAYRYYAFKIADIQDAGYDYMSMRRLELQTEDGYEEGTSIMFTFSAF